MNHHDDREFLDLLWSVGTDVINLRAMLANPSEHTPAKLRAVRGRLHALGDLVGAAADELDRTLGV